MHLHMLLQELMLQLLQMQKLVIAILRGRKELLELVLLYFVVLGIARLLESNAGNAFNQGWQFYAVTVCLFLVLAYPGFVWRYLWQHRRATR